MNNTEIFENDNNPSFSWYDYILFTFMLGVSVLIGIYFGCFGSKQSTAQEYLMGGKKMKVFPISMSLIASHISGITLLAVPADIYRYGTSYWLLVVALLIVAFVTVYVYLPIFFKLQITSTYEYLERRFDSRNRQLASFLFALSLFLYLPIVIYLPALAFSAATGINVHLITPLVCGVCIFYTTIGGLKAVVWTDTFQFTITIGAVVTVFFLGIKSVGGVSNVWHKAAEGGRLNIFDFDLDPTKRDSFWITLIGMTTGWTSICSINQGCVQKFLSLPTLRAAKLSVILFSIGMAIISSFSIFTGLIIYAKYADCDPFTLGRIARSDQLLPYYIMDVAASIPGLSGLFIAGIFCAALSTLSACLNCVAGTIYEDFICKCIPTDIDENASSFILKVVVVVVGVACTGLVFIIEHMGGILPLAISLGSVTQGPMLGQFVLGALHPRATKRGTFYGSLLTLVFVSWVVAMAQYYKSQGLIHYDAKPTTIHACVGVNGSSDKSATQNSIAVQQLSTSVSDEFAFNHITDTNLSSIVDIEQNQMTQQPFALFRISYYYYNTLGAILTILLGIVISYFDKDDSPIHPDTVCPFVHCLLPPTNNERLSMEYIDYYDLNKAIHLVMANTTEKQQNKTGINNEPQ